MGAYAYAHGFGLGVVEGREAHRRQGPEVGLGGPLQVEFVVELLGCDLGGVAVLETKLTEPAGCDRPTGLRFRLAANGA